jgi:PAS domain-containing protein
MATVMMARLAEGALQGEHTLLDHLPIACVVMDADFRMTCVNGAAEKLFGYENCIYCKSYRARFRPVLHFKRVLHVKQSPQTTLVDDLVGDAQNWMAAAVAARGRTARFGFAR